MQESYVINYEDIIYAVKFIVGLVGCIMAYRTYMYRKDKRNLQKAK